MTPADARSSATRASSQPCSSFLSRFFDFLPSLTITYGSLFPFMSAAFRPTPFFRKTLSTLGVWWVVWPRLVSPGAPLSEAQLNGATGIALANLIKIYLRELPNDLFGEVRAEVDQSVLGPPAAAGVPLAGLRAAAAAGSVSTTEVHRPSFPAYS